ncbi:hypothetical protein [Nannocystis pusilla]|uniref:Uncharacterized protein n=1 Tax=Nannocystis pusilla TaxID=889268 RepID=A0ABS7TXP2_9BACT|nr:hypothetical protein [Nannocystis pusilla]MBZ5713000.1 hypothetical protein [Nannocystis pusilla]
MVVTGSLAPDDVDEDVEEVTVEVVSVAVPAGSGGVGPQAQSSANNNHGIRTRPVYATNVRGVGRWRPRRLHFRRTPGSSKMLVMSDAPLVALYSLGFLRRFAHGARRM